MKGSVRVAEIRGCLCTAALQKEEVKEVEELHLGCGRKGACATYCQ
jgi:hypothetical protein